MQCKANCGRETDWKLDPLDELCTQCFQASKECLKDILDKEAIKKDAIKKQVKKDEK